MILTLKKTEPLNVVKRGAANVVPAGKQAHNRCRDCTTGTNFLRIPGGNTSFEMNYPTIVISRAILSEEDCLGSTLHKFARVHGHSFRSLIGAGSNKIVVALTRTSVILGLIAVYIVRQRPLIK